MKKEKKTQIVTILFGCALLLLVNPIAIMNFFFENLPVLNF